MDYEVSTSDLTFRRMSTADRRDVFALFSELVLRDDYFRDSRGAYVGTLSGREPTEAALGEALTLFVDRPDYGDVHLDNEAGKQFYRGLDFEPSHEERMALLL